MPSSAIQKQDAMSALGDMAGDFFKMQLHRFSIGMRQRKGSTCAACRANRTEEIGIGIALISRLARPCSTPGPLSHNAILLANAGFVLEPDFNRCRGGNAIQMGLQRVSEVFLNAAIVSASCPGWRGRALMWEKPSCFSNVPTWRS